MIWRDVVGFEGIYKVSDDGRVFSCFRQLGDPGVMRSSLGKLINLFDGHNGYKRVCLSKEGKEVKKFVHRLVAEVFIRPPSNNEFINHKNGIKSDNRVCNLEWVTPAENTKHAFQTGLMEPMLDSLRKPITAISSDDPESILFFRSIQEATEHGFTYSKVWQACKHRNRYEYPNKYRGYFWNYVSQPN